jgi:hypothetical protein
VMLTTNPHMQVGHAKVKFSAQLNMVRTWVLVCMCVCVCVYVCICECMCVCVCA